MSYEDRVGPCAPHGTRGGAQFCIQCLRSKLDRSDERCEALREALRLALYSLEWGGMHSTAARVRSALKQCA